MSIGETIRKLRKERKMTLLDLSMKSGVALATLSRMETGKMIGTLTSHVNICRALEVSLPDLYEDLVNTGKKVEMQAHDARSDVAVHDARTKSELLTSNSLNKKMLPTMINIAKDGRTQQEEAKFGIEKFIYVLDGKLEANIGREKFNLVKGDTLYFGSSIPHYFKNTGKTDAQFISIVSPPAL